MEKNKTKKLVLIDGMSLLHRAYHAYPAYLTTKEGEQVNAVYGFTSILLNVLEKLEPTHVAVAWDVGKPTFRHEEYEKYKENRAKPDDELIGQIGRTQEVVTTLNIPQFGVEGFEADDVVGTLAREAGEDKDAEVVIVTGDRDSLQLVRGERVVVWMPASSGRFAKDRGPRIFDEKAVEAKYGLEPKQIIDLKGLMGDASDDIPGVKGVGEKTAEKLLEAFSSVEEIYELLGNEEDEKRVEEVVGKRVVNLLKNDKEMAILSKKLATIDCEVPIELKWEACKLSDYDRNAVIDLFERLEFKSLVKKLPKDGWDEEVDEIFGM